MTLAMTNGLVLCSPCMELQLSVCQWLGLQLHVLSEYLTKKETVEFSISDSESIFCLKNQVFMMMLAVINSVSGWL